MRVIDVKPVNKLVLDTKPDNFQVLDVKPNMIKPFSETQVYYSGTTILHAGMPMGLLLAITYPTVGTITGVRS